MLSTLTGTCRRVSRARCKRIVSDPSAGWLDGVRWNGKAAMMPRSERMYKHGK